VVLINGQRFDLRQIGPDYLQRAAADYLAILLGDKEGLKVRINIRHRAKQHLVSLGVGIYQAVYGPDVIYICTANVHNN
jgi:hypothetical protein